MSLVSLPNLSESSQEYEQHTILSCLGLDSSVPSRLSLSTHLLHNNRLANLLLTLSVLPILGGRKTISLLHSPLATFSSAELTDSEIFMPCRVAQLSNPGNV